MKYLIIALLCCLLGTTAQAQDAAATIKEATNLERQLKDIDALAKYKDVLNATPANIAIMVKCTEIDCNIGDRANPADKHTYYDEALYYAQQAYNTDSNNADASYSLALVKDRQLTIEKESKKKLELQREIKLYADKALAINANHGRANYLVGKWNYDIVTLPELKQAAIKTFHKGFSDVDIDSAITYMEKCRTVEQYYAPNYLVLAKAYRYKKRPAQAIEVLSRLVKLPTRTPNDVAIKAEGQALLTEMQ